MFTQPRKGKQLKGLRLSAARVPRVVDCAKIGFQLWGGARTLLHCGTCIPSGLQVGTLHANSQHVIAYINAAEYANLLLPAQLRRRKLGQLQQRKKRREKKTWKGLAHAETHAAKSGKKVKMQFVWRTSQLKLALRLRTDIAPGRSDTPVAPPRPLSSPCKR